MTRVPNSSNRSVRTMRKDELMMEAHRLGIKNPEGYLVPELRKVVTARRFTYRKTGA